jgi:two-component system response regulator MtrA
MKTILVVDDERHIVDLVRLYLEKEGFAVVAAHDGVDALDRHARHDPDLVILDVMLPKLDGFEVCREIRRRGDTPVLMLTARDDDVDAIVGLELGADDYVTKPFELPELVARVKAVLRRAAPTGDGGTLNVAGLEIDPDGFTARKRGEELQLTATEFRLLLELARRPKQVFTRELLLELVWNYDYLGDSRLVDAAVQRLRAKIEDDPKQPALIKTVRGVGYRFAAGS